VIKPGQFQEFPVSAGPLPATDKLVFKALQTYSDGNVVRWIEEPGADGKEPEHPAPVLKLKPKATTSPSPGVEPVAGSGDSGAAGGDAESASGSAGLLFGVAGLVAGLAGFVLGGLAFLRTRRRPESG
jgi:periplasmic copper chaperone A